MAMEMSATTGAGGDLSRALAFVQGAFAQWRGQGLMSGQEFDRLQAYYEDLKRGEQSGRSLVGALTLPAPDLCWSCKEPVGANDYCAGCGAPIRAEAVDRLRYLVCLCHEIRKHERAGRLELSAAHGCLADANGRIASLRRKLNDQRAPFALPVNAAPPIRSRPVVEAVLAEPASVQAPLLPSAPRRSLLEMLLDPRSIQWLLGAGGAVLVIGLVLALWASGIFKEAWVVAVFLGAGNAVLLAGGLATVRFTRYQLGGRALTFLACLVMPLNLWFYDAQHLITIELGDHLWIAALVCVALYAATAVLVRDPALVYVFVGGVTLTGLLLLADHTVGGVEVFWEAPAPCAFLAMLGVACIHVVRVFPKGEGPFTRGKFGLAFFWSGHAVLAASLLVLLTAQLTCGLFYVSFRDFYLHLDTYLGYPEPGMYERSEIVATVWGQLLALGIVAAATYAYVYSDLLVRKVGVYIHLAVVAFLWAEILLVHLAFTALPDLKEHAWEIVIMALALTGLLAKVLLTMFVPTGWGLRRTVPALALILSLVPLGLGTWMHVEAVVWVLKPLTAWFVAAMLVSAVACRFSAYLHQGGLSRFIRPSVGPEVADAQEHQPAARDRWLMTIYLFGGGGSLLLAASGLLMTYDHELAKAWVWVAPILILIPLAYLIAARLYRGRALETPVVWAAHAMTLVLVVTCLCLAVEEESSLGGIRLVHNDPRNLVLACFFAEAAVFYLLAGVWRDREFAVYACAASAAAALWQLLTAYDHPSEYYIGAFALLGLALLVVYRFVVLEAKPTAGLGRAAFQSANALLTLAVVAGALKALIVLMAPVDPKFGLEPVVALQTLLAIAALAALFLVRQPAWRRWYLVAAIGNAALTVLVVILKVNWLDNWQKLELACLPIGAALLILSYVGWFREQERENDMVSFGLLLGCLLLAVPLTWAVFYCRFSSREEFDTFHTLNEVGMLAAGLLLLGGGVVTRIKSTTITGAAVLLLYLLTLPALLHVKNGVWQIAIFLTIGGGLFFGVGLLLAVYRDRLLALPEKIKRHEGMFRILNWR
jgi:hypothetical protein